MQDDHVPTVLRNIQESKSEVYRIGAFSALVVVLIYLVDLVVVITNGIAPQTVPELFDLFQRNRLIGLLQAFSLDIVAATLHVPIFIALFVSLLPVRRSFHLLSLSLTLAFVGIAVYFSYNSVFSMVYLSDQYAAATDPAVRQQLLSAGHAFLSSFNANGTGPFMAFTLYALSGILVSAVMRRSSSYGNVIGWIGITGSALELGPPTGLYPEVWGRIDPVLIGLGGLLLMIWYFEIFERLLGLANQPTDRSGSEDRVNL